MSAVPATFQQPGPFPLNAQPANVSLYLGNLDKVITENIIFDKFSRYGKIIRFRVVRDKTTNESRGFAFVEFLTAKDAEAAKTAMSNEKLGNQFIRVLWSGEHNKRIPQANIFVRNIDRKITQGDLENYFQRWGSVMSTHLSVNDKGESNGYGFIQFRTEEDAKKCLDESQNEALRLGELDIKCESFKSNQEREVLRTANRKNLLILDAPLAVNEEQVRTICNAFGTVKSIRLGKSPDNENSYVLVAFSEHEEAEKALAGFADKLGSAFQGQSKAISVHWHKTKAELKQERKKAFQQEKDKTLYMRNLKADTTKKTLEDALKAVGAPVERITLKDFDATENPQTNVTFKVRYAFIKMQSKELVETVMKHKNEEGIVNLFKDKKVYIDIALPKADRASMKQIRQKQKYYTFPQHQAFGTYGQFPFPFQMPFPAPGYGMAPMQQRPTMRPTNYRPSNQSRRPYPNTYPPHRGGMQQRVGPMGQQLQNPNFPPYGAQSQQPPRPPQMPRPVEQPKPEPKKIDLNFIQKNWDNFKKMKPEEKRNILGELLYPLVVKIIGAQLAPKITGMLVDFEVMSEEEIVEAIEKSDVLAQRIQEAREALDEAGDA